MLNPCPRIFSLSCQQNLISLRHSRTISTSLSHSRDPPSSVPCPPLSPVAPRPSSPPYLFTLDTVGKTLANNFVSSNMDSIASMFNSWSGDIGFKVIVPGSSMSRVRLAITYSWSKPSAFSENMRYMYVEVDSTATIDAVIPWSQVMPYLPLPLTRGASTAMSPNGYFSIFQ